MTKTPFNWVGNKYKFLPEINKILNKKYDYVYDIFMGSGNLVLNLNVEAKFKIGNDKIKLLPNIFTALREKGYVYELEDVENILNRFNRFSNKDDYYIFRDYWNEKYKKNIFDKEFILETVLLLKMCSNSMVRFNNSGLFNQGFRGLGTKKEFFTENMKTLCVNELNKLSVKLKNSNFTFLNLDFKDMKLNEGSNLLILDPPYSLWSDMYTVDWKKEHDEKLFEFMRNSNNDFIYFNYLERDGVVNEELLEFINENNLTVIEINNKTSSGQGRIGEVRSVKEVLITNVK